MMSSLFPVSVTMHIDVKTKPDLTSGSKMLEEKPRTTFNIDLPIVRVEAEEQVKEVGSGRRLRVQHLRGFDCDGNEYIIRVPYGALK